MKGVPGLMIALALGVVGAFCNWFYLAQKGAEMARVDFIVIEEGTKINPGDKFREEHFRKLSIPKNATDQLEKAAPHWEEIGTIVGTNATKSFTPGEIVLRQYLKTPPENDIKKLLAPDERAFGVPIDTRTFVPSLLGAGDQVSFIPPPTVTSHSPGERGEGAAPPGAPIGPFRILAMGNRLGTKEVLTAAGAATAQEGTMTVALKTVGTDFEPRARQLLDLIQSSGNTNLQVILHPAADAKKK